MGAQRAVFASEPKEKGALDKSLPWVMVAFVAVSLVATLVGGRSNAKRSLAWEEEFCKEGAILQKSFTQLGKGALQAHSQASLKGSFISGLTPVLSNRSTIRESGGKCRL